MTWTTTRLKHIARVGYGLGQPPTLSETGIPILRATNIMRGKFTSDGLIFATKQDLPLDRAPLLREGEILVVRSGAYTGDSAIVTSAWAGSAPGYDLRVTPIDADPRYVAYCLLSTAALDQVDLAKSRAAQPHLNAEDLGDIALHAPSLDEQRRIVDFLDAETAQIDRMIELRRGSKSLIEEKRFATIARLATVGAGPIQTTNDLWIPVTGEGWDVVPLKRRWRIIDCKHRTPTYVEEGYPVISPGDISPGRLNPSVAHRFVGEDDYRDLADHLRRARRGDIVYGRNASVGIAAFVDTDEKFTMGQDVCRITSADQDQLFLAYFLNTAALAQLGSVQIGSTFTRVNIGTLLELSVACPPVQEQCRVAAEMDLISQEASQITSAIDRQLALLAERRQALITAAVTGGISV